MQTTKPLMYISKLTSRELEVIHLVVFEYSTNEIAQKLFLSHETIKSHRRKIMHKLEVKNVAGIVREAIIRNLVSFQTELKTAY